MLPPGTFERHDFGATAESSSDLFEIICGIVVVHENAAI